MKLIPTHTQEGRWQRAVICNAEGNPLDNGCGAQLLVEASDLFARAIALGGRVRGTFAGARMTYHVQCPCCGAWNQVSENALPPEVQQVAAKTRVPSPQQYFRVSPAETIGTALL